MLGVLAVVALLQQDRPPSPPVGSAHEVRLFQESAGRSESADDCFGIVLLDLRSLVTITPATARRSPRPDHP